MVTYRVHERKEIGAKSSFKGWSLHNEEALMVHNQFKYFLKNRKSTEKVSIKRTRGSDVHAASNRTTAADYKTQGLQVDVSELDGVIAIDAEARLMHIQPGLPMDELARAALAHGWVPEVVLEFPGITAGGAVCGGGIESSSHRFGSFFDTVHELDIITGDGQWHKSVSRTCEPDLFHALSVSFGTHGIITRLAVRIEPAPRLVLTRYYHFDSLAGATAAMEALANQPQPPAFIDGVAMSPTSAMVVVGEAVPHGQPNPDVPYLSLRANRSDPWFFWHLVRYPGPFILFADQIGQLTIIPC